MNKWKNILLVSIVGIVIWGTIGGMGTLSGSSEVKAQPRSYPTNMGYAACLVCDKGSLVLVSGVLGSGWICTNPYCDYIITTYPDFNRTVVKMNKPYRLNPMRE